MSRAFIHGLNQFDSMKNEIFNVGLSSANISKYELCLEIKKFVPDLVIYNEEFTKDEDQRNYIVSNKKIENTGFYPSYDLHYGISELIKGYKMFQKYIYGNV